MLGVVAPDEKDSDSGNGDENACSREHRDFDGHCIHRLRQNRVTAAAPIGASPQTAPRNIKRKST